MKRSALGMIVLAILILVLNACASQPDRVVYASVGEAIKALYAASANQYVDCHTSAGTEAEEDACFDEKNARGDKIGEVLPYFDAYGQALITADAVETDSNLTRVRAILAALTPSLLENVDADRRRAIEWLDQ